MINGNVLEAEGTDIRSVCLPMRVHVRRGKLRACT